MACLLHDLSFGMNVAAISETHFVYYVNVQVLSNDFVVYGDWVATGVSLLAKCSLIVSVDFVYIEMWLYFILLSVGAVPGESSKPSSNGGPECHLGPQARQGQRASGCVIIARSI